MRLTTGCHIPIRTLFFSAALLLGQAGCIAPVTHRPPAEYEPGDCPILPQSGIEEDQMECGWLNVPENRDDPASQTIRLRVIVFKTKSVKPAPDPVIYLAGGPGSSAIEEGRFRMDDFQEIMARRDLVVVDQRGTGYSRPALECPDYAIVFKKGLALQSYQELDDQLNQALRDCQSNLKSAGIDLTAYTNLENATDIEDLRLALGYRQWNLLGVSYGTRLALTILREFSTGVRSVILDSTYPPEVEPYSGRVLSTERAFQVLFDTCTDQPRCSRAYPDLEADFYRLVERLDAEPIQVKVRHPILGTKVDVNVDGDTLISALFANLYDINAIGSLPFMIEDTLAGGTSELSRSLSIYLLTPHFVNWGMHYSVMCSAESDFTTVEQVHQDSGAAQSRLARFMLDNQLDALELCQTWDHKTPAEEENRQVRSNVPALVLAGEFDPVTPPSWGEHAAGGLKRARFYTFPWMSHAVTAYDEVTNGCVTQLVTSFLDKPSSKPADGCMQELPEMEFFVP
jgi:pimeloyl-ACP methyl ester carboxylesterase